MMLAEVAGAVRSTDFRVADCLYPVSARIDEEGRVVVRVIDFANARRTIVRPPVRHSGLPKRIHRCPTRRFEAPMPCRSIIRPITIFDRQVISAWLVPIAPFTVSQPKFRFANLWDAQRS